MSYLFAIAMLLLAYGFVTLIEKHQMGWLLVGFAVLAVIVLGLVVLSLSGHAEIAIIAAAAIIIQLIETRLKKK